LGTPERQFVDPSVSAEKFDREIDDFLSIRSQYEQRGWFLVEASFPKVFLIATAANLHPPAVVFGVSFDFANYDARPPSVRIVDPFTRRPLVGKELPTTLNRAVPADAVEIPGLPGQLQMVAAQPLMQFHDPEDIPFLCLAGVKEYHDHPGHSGDAWELHRSSGAGRLGRLVDVIHTYGVQPIRGFGVNLVPQVAIDFGEPAR
jgi:hypothetical protein